jgi:hypothetical protein
MPTPDPLERQMGLAAGDMRHLATLLREYGYPDKADEAYGAAEIADEWAREYRKDKEAKDNA